MEDMVEIIQYFDGKGNLYKKTANGVELPILNDLLPTVAIQKFWISKKEYNQIYGKLK